MKHSEINFKIQLDDQNIPEQISWSATDNPNEGIEETKAILVATWDPYHKGTLTLPLWTKDMEVLDMKRFFIEVLGTISDASAQATGDEEFAKEVDSVCRKLSLNLKKEIETLNKQQ
ncbi:gliding motility protein GldC [Sandaracinomonas limnophila]|uniref:Gliding motility protein GldC n=1 Tax=Sandaracinomonas limnophila TaxID=1862386 RepID=A0A437PWH6_9BACT|nr:gliding motility protein GldC [Sandaracinomonas limnophila]RVU26603.1 gliding motility protein GldC [Sandaracinomonas limnophila]